MDERKKKKEAWDFAFGMIKIDGLEPTEEFKTLAEKEVNGEITTADIREILDAKYTAKGREDRV